MKTRSIQLLATATAAFGVTAGAFACGTSSNDPASTTDSGTIAMPADATLTTTNPGSGDDDDDGASGHPDAAGGGGGGGGGDDAGPSDASSNDGGISVSRLSPTLTDLALIYMGAVARHAAGTSAPLVWTPSDFAAYVSAPDATGKPAWLFDSFLFLELTTNNGRSEGRSFTTQYGNLPATKQDWCSLLGRYFTTATPECAAGAGTTVPVDAGGCMMNLGTDTDGGTASYVAGTGVANLEAAVEAAQASIGSAPVRERQVMFALPYPIKPINGTVGKNVCPYAWGSLGGTQVLMANDEGRLRAVQWYIDSVLARWKEQHPQHLAMAGFYWLQEFTIGDDATAMDAGAAPFVKQVADYVHSVGAKLYWIPSWAGYASTPDGGASLGFDSMYIQPNYYQRGYSTRCVTTNPNDISLAPDSLCNDAGYVGVSPHDTRMQAATTIAARAGLGLEVEFDSNLHTDPTDYVPLLQTYFSGFDDAGLGESDRVAYYEGGGEIIQLASADASTSDKAIYGQLTSWILRRERLADEKP